jgi:membrane protease YdiL (CAAX protease family)
VGTTALVTAISQLAPEDYANTAVGIAFLAVTWWLVLRADTETVRAYGLSLGGLTEPVKLEPSRLLRESLRALGWASLMGAIFYPAFFIGYRMWWKVAAPWAWTWPDDVSGRVLGQLLVIALPEEAFFRGYLQSALDGHWAARRWRILGAELGPGWLISASIFAIGHVLTINHPSRLAVFFPALVFGWLRARTGGVGASVLFHAMCNLFSATLAHGYGLD